MKKIVLFIAVVSAFSFASCKKDRTCTCVDSPGGNTTVRTYTKVEKSSARAACLSATEVVNNVTYTRTCTLK